MNDSTNQLSTNRDNIAASLLRAHIVTQKSQKTGNDYHQLVETWNHPNGKTYEVRHFITNEQKMLLEMTVPLTSNASL